MGAIDYEAFDKHIVNKSVLLLYGYDNLDKMSFWLCKRLKKIIFIKIFIIINLSI